MSIPYFSEKGSLFFRKVWVISSFDSVISPESSDSTKIYLSHHCSEDLITLPEAVCLLPPRFGSFSGKVGELHPFLEPTLGPGSQNKVFPHQSVIKL